jgi:hypothetical protein
MKDNCVNKSRVEKARKTKVLRAGSVFEVRLDEQPGVGASWVWKSKEANDFLEEAEPSSIRDGGGGYPGSSSVRVFTLRAKRAGRGELKLALTLPGGEGPPENDPTKNFVVPIEVK